MKHTCILCISIVVRFYIPADNSHLISDGLLSSNGFVFLKCILIVTPGPVPLGLAYVLLVETNPFPNLSLFYRTMLFEYPSVLSRFCLLLFLLKEYCLLRHYLILKSCLVGCIEDLRRFSGISAISRLGSRR